MSWATVTLSEVTHIISGGTPKSGVTDYWEGDVEWLTPKDMGKMTSIYASHTGRKITELGLSKSSAKLIPQNSVILSTRAPIGHLAINTVPMATNQGCRGLVPKDNLNTKYLYYFLSKSVKLLNDLGSGTTFKELSKGALERLTLPLPPIEEQKRIVTILDTVFADLEQARAKTEQNLKNARDLFDSYLQQVFSQDREVAAKSGWVTKYISDVICKTKTVDPRKSPESEFLYVDVSGVSNQTLEITDSTKLAGKDAPSRARRVITEGDIIFATVRPTLRRIAVVPSHLDGEVCSTGYFVFQPKSELYNRYLYYFLQSDTFMVEMEKLQKGASYPAVNDSQVKSRLISYPSIPEQKRIVETLDSLNNAVNELKATYTKKLNSIDDLKKSILQKAFSGELTTTAT